MTCKSTQIACAARRIGRALREVGATVFPVSVGNDRIMARTPNVVGATG